MHIKVQYPTTETIVTKTADEMKAMGYQNKPLVHYLPINREYQIRVKGNKTVTCEQLTGMTDTEYQNKFNVAWNE